MVMCNHCNEDPCILTIHGEVIRSAIPALDMEWTENQKRKYLYKMFIRAEHGRLGRGVRKKIPICVLEYIHDLFPSPDGNYMGHMWE